MPQAAPAPFQPRKSPVQARSAASVEAILQATTQVLRDIGKERLTTTRVAARAGVSVGTLYQYFPNKSSLLQAALRCHMEAISASMIGVCHEQKGRPVQGMATALINAYLDAKMADSGISVALYAVSSDVDGAKIAQSVSARLHKAVIALLATSSTALTKSPQIVASMLLAAMTGVSRRLLELPHPERQLEPFREELLFFAHAYLDACTAQGR